VQDKKILTNQELQEGISKRLIEMENPEFNLGEARVYFSGVGKLLSSVKRDMDAAEHMGTPYRPHTKKFLGIE
jgi:hypothetical protein